MVLQSLFRLLQHGCVITVLALVAFPFRTDAASPLTSSWDGDHQRELVDDDELFLVGNTLFAVYHEFGHALIDLLRLPVIGREEDAVDGLAAILMIPERPDMLRDALIVAVADGWQAQSASAAGRRKRHYWGKHALDEQRHFAIVCLMVGSDQEGFYTYAIDAGLPEQRIATCPEDFSNTKTGWQRLLEPHRPKHVEGEATAIPSIGLIFDAPLPEQKTVIERLRASDLLERAIDDLNNEATLPSSVTIRFTICNEANAFWSPGNNEITVCYELIEAFDAILNGASGL